MHDFNENGTFWGRALWWGSAQQGNGRDGTEVMASPAQDGRNGPSDELLGAGSAGRGRPASMAMSVGANGFSLRRHPRDQLGADLGLAS